METVIRLTGHELSWSRWMALNHNLARLMHRYAWHSLFQLLWYHNPWLGNCTYLRYRQGNLLEIRILEVANGFPRLRRVQLIPLDYSSTNIIVRRMRICQYHWISSTSAATVRNEWRFQVLPVVWLNGIHTAYSNWRVVFYLRGLADWETPHSSICFRMVN
jgi:hypothetical protein